MTTRAVPSGTVAFLFTDIEGSTKRWQADRVGMGAAVARHDQLLRAEVVRRGGYVFKTVGDAVCAAFETVPQAVAAALAGQRALAAEPWGAPGPIRARMAVHVGAAEERDADYFGPAVNRIARLLSAGHGGQVLLSLPAAELARDALPADALLRDLGRHRLKDLARPERIYQLLAPDLPDDFPALVTLDHRPNNLPPQPTPLVGREAEAARVAALLGRAGVRLVTLTGPGGTGKTRLSLQVAADLLDGFPGGVWFVELEEATDEDAVVAAVARALGAREAPGQAPRAALAEHLQPKTLLLVLDNFEQVARAAPLVGRLLEDAPAAKALVSSRLPLGIRGEHLVPVPPLGVPPREPGKPDPARLARYEAVRLFVQRASAAKSDFALTDDNADAVARICRALDGLPLAIELAAARVKVLPPRALLARLEDTLGVLVGGGRHGSARQQTLRGAIAWSHDLLPPAERTLFARLAVFAGGFDPEAAEAAANPGGDLDLFGALSALVDHSLVRQEETPDGEARFAMLATIRAFAREQLELAGGGEAELTRMLHGEHYLALARAAEPHLTGPEQAGWLARLGAEHDNLRAALAWFADAGEPDQAARLATALWRFWHVRGHLAEGRGWLERVLSAGADLPTDLRAAAATAAGILAWAQADLTGAAALLHQALAAHAQADDALGTARVRSHLGLVAADLGDYAAARGHFEASRALCERLGNARGIAAQAANLGMVAFLEADFDRAVGAYEDALAQQRRVGNPHDAAVALVNLAEAREYQGDTERGLALYQQALERFREFGDRQRTAFALAGIARILRRRGDDAQASTLLREALGLARESGDAALVAACLEAAAGMQVDAARPDAAARLFGAADRLRRAGGAPLAAVYRDAVTRDADRARADLGHAAWDAALAVGATVPDGRAADEALALLGTTA